MTLRGNMKNWTRWRDYYCCISLFVSCYINISSLMMSAANCKRISCLQFFKKALIFVYVSPASTHPFHSSSCSSKRSIHSICGFLAPFCQLRMSNASLGCSVSPALGNTEQEVIPCTAVKCYVKDTFLKTMLLCPEVTGTSAWDVPPSLCCAAFTVLLYVHAVHITLCSPDLLIIWNRGSFLSFSLAGCPLVVLGHGQDAHRMLWDALHTTLAQQCCHRHVCLCTFTSMNAL